jgi:hypothetical protein
MLRAITAVIFCVFAAIHGFPAVAQEQGPKTCEERLDDSRMGLSADTSTTANEPIVIGTGEWPPISSEAYFAPYMSYGRAADVVSSAFREVGKKRVSFEFISFGAAYEGVQDNRIAGAFPFYKTATRESESLFSDPLLTVTDVVFYDKVNAPYLKDVTSLDELLRAIERHGQVDPLDSARFVLLYCYDDSVDKAFGRDCTRRDPDRDLAWDLDAFRALVSDRDALVLPSAKVVGDRILQTWFNKDERSRIGVIEGLSWQRDVYLVAPCQQESKRLIAAFNAGLENIRASGQWERMAEADLHEESVLRGVRLSDPGTFPLIVARKSRDSEETVVLPRGTGAMVHIWSRNFHTPQKTTLQQQLNEMSRVMITNGPQRGQLLWVKNVFIELDASPQ